MTIQHFYTGTTVSFPDFSYSWGGGGQAQQLRRLYWNGAANTLMGLFVTDPTNYALGQTNVRMRWQLHKIWRDGTLLQAGSGIPQVGYMTELSEEPRVLQTSDNRVVRAPTDERLFNIWDYLLASGDPPTGYYQVNPLWPQDMVVPGKLAYASLAEPKHAGVLVPAVQMLLLQPGSGSFNWKVTYTTVLESGTLWSGPDLASYSAPRDLLYIDGSTCAITFVQTSAGLNLDNSLPAVIRVFDTTTTPWTLLWSDTLPATDQVAAYDPTNKILYSTGRFPATTTMHASKLKRTPAAPGSITVVSGTSAFQELTATVVSTLITDSLGSVISSVLMQWTLDAAVSQGVLVSAYSRTTTAGIATITYVGPYSPPADLEEHINATVAEVDPA